MKKLFTIHRRLVVACLVTIVPLVTLAVVDGLAQIRLAASMTDTANRFLASLSADQKARLAFQFETQERYSWHYIPRMRKGLALREFTPRQKQLALELLKTGLSTAGYKTAQEIMSLERVLIGRERNGSMPMVRDPENYFVSIFGTPSRTAPWGWRVEGHHISVNFMVAEGKVQDHVMSNTPLFFGAEPALVQGGPMKGLRPLGSVEEKAQALMAALDERQRQTAIIGRQVPVDIFTGNSREPDLGSQLNPIGLSRQPQMLEPRGLLASQLTPAQKQLLRTLVMDYVSRMPDEIGARRTKELEADFDMLGFAWMGGTSAADAQKPTRGFGCDDGDTRWECISVGFPYYYRVQGPRFLIEYMNTSGNHSHSVWRDFNGADFGEDLLREHYASVPHDGSATVPAVLAAR